MDGGRGAAKGEKKGGAVAGGLAGGWAGVTSYDTDTLPVQQYSGHSHGSHIVIQEKNTSSCQTGPLAAAVESLQTLRLHASQTRGTIFFSLDLSLSLSVSKG